MKSRDGKFASVVGCFSGSKLAIARQEKYNGTEGKGNAWSEIGVHEADTLITAVKRTDRKK